MTGITYTLFSPTSISNCFVNVHKSSVTMQAIDMIISFLGLVYEVFSNMYRYKTTLSSIVTTSRAMPM